MWKKLPIIVVKSNNICPGISATLCIVGHAQIYLVMSFLFGIFRPDRRNKIRASSRHNHFLAFHHLEMPFCCLRLTKLFFFLLLRSLNDKKCCDVIWIGANEMWSNTATAGVNDPTDNTARYIHFWQSILIKMVVQKSISYRKTNERIWLDEWMNGYAVQFQPLFPEYIRRYYKSWEQKLVSCVKVKISAYLNWAPSFAHVQS